MTTTRYPWIRVGVLGGAVVAAVVLGAFLVRPFDAGPTAIDATASVLYFDRIVAGRHLEAFVDTTPKPLVTLVYGGLHALTGDWRPAAWATVLALAAGVVMAAELARRVAGREAAAFAAVALFGSVALLREASWGQGLPWAFAAWMAAGLALSRPSPRFGLAGAFLFLGALARPETFLLLGVATACLAWRAIRGPRAPRVAGLLLIGWLSIAVLGVHDLLLTGDPLWWAKVAAISAAGRHTPSIGAVARLNLGHVVALSLLVVPGVVGALVLVRRRAWLAFWGLAAIGPLVALETLGLAFRRLPVLGHYLDPVDLAVILAAAIGVGTVLAWARREAGRRLPTRYRVAPAVAGLVVSVLAAAILSRPFAPLSDRGRHAIGLQADFALRVDEIVPSLALAVASIPTPDRSGPGPYAAPAPVDIVVFVPHYQVYRLAVMLDVPESRIRWLDVSKVDVAAGYPAVGSIVYTDGVLDPSSVTDGTAILRSTAPTTVGGVRIVPLLVDPARQVWIVRVERAP